MSKEERGKRETIQQEPTVSPALDHLTDLCTTQIYVHMEPSIPLTNLNIVMNESIIFNLVSVRKIGQ